MSVLCEESESDFNEAEESEVEFWEKTIKFVDVVQLFLLLVY
jgi:hypothetical protein